MKYFFNKSLNIFFYRLSDHLIKIKVYDFLMITK